MTWHLLDELRRSVPPRVSSILFSLHDEVICRTMLHERLDPNRPPQASVERWIRGFAAIRRTWIEVAHEAVGDAGITPLRVDAIAITRAALRRLRPGSAARTDLEAALCDAGPILSGYASARHLLRPLDGTLLRRLSTRYDYCVTAALLAEFGAIGPDMTFATPLLCSEARIAAAKLRRLVALPVGRGPARAERGAGPPPG